MAVVHSTPGNSSLESLSLHASGVGRFGHHDPTGRDIKGLSKALRSFERRWDISARDRQSPRPGQLVVKGKMIVVENCFAGLRAHNRKTIGEEKPQEDVAIVLEMLWPGITTDDNRDWRDDWSSYPLFTGDWGAVHRLIDQSLVAHGFNPPC
ncbi:hypothetical protein Slin15195_G055760 [Septoria linicola]|uniref:Uncharacterized protein n=1 Tax=Septoria linicola TaxID=215465 RepID=A0A9Q9AUJ2_9PEZI|nr:hypothetical protein Slin15195_G055760 [Septoria linicola]